MAPRPVDIEELQAMVLELAVAQARIANAVLSLANMARRTSDVRAIYGTLAADKVAHDSEEAFDAIARVARRLEEALDK